MIYDPITVVRSGELAFTEEGIAMRNWYFDMGDRPGEPSDYPCEVLIAVRDRVVANINARILMMPDEQFEDSRINSAFISQLEECAWLVPQPGKTVSVSKKLPWWRKILK